MKEREVGRKKRREGWGREGRKEGGMKGRSVGGWREGRRYRVSYECCINIHLT